MFILLLLLYVSVNVQSEFVQRNIIPNVNIVYKRHETGAPRVKQLMCFLEPDPGPCRSELEQYYYSVGSNACGKFIWGGCQGNGNRFDTEEECMQTCQTNSRELKKPKYCDLKFDYGFCFGATDRWFYDSLWKVCKKTIYSGCGGNKNNFYNQESCDRICRFSGEFQKPDGKSKDGIERVIISNHGGGRKDMAAIGSQLIPKAPEVENDVVSAVTEKPDTTSGAVSVPSTSNGGKRKELVPPGKDKERV